MKVEKEELAVSHQVEEKELLRQLPERLDIPFKMSVCSKHIARQRLSSCRELRK